MQQQQQTEVTLPLLLLLLLLPLLILASKLRIEQGRCSYMLRPLLVQLVALPAAPQPVI